MNNKDRKVTFKCIDFCLERKQTGKIQREKSLWAGMFGNFMDEVGFELSLEAQVQFW